MGRPKGVPNKKGRLAWVQVKCDTCGKPFGRAKSHVKPRNFCSPPCVRYDRAGDKNPRWSGGNRTWRGTGWQELRQRILDRDGHRCIRCGAEGVRLEVSHIRPFAEFESEAEANDDANLQTLCVPCHRRFDWSDKGTEAANPLHREHTVTCADCGVDFLAMSYRTKRCPTCSPRRIRR